MKRSILIITALCIVALSGIALFRSFSSLRDLSQETPVESLVSRVPPQLPKPSIAEQTPPSSPQEPLPTSLEIRPPEASAGSTETGSLTGLTPRPTEISAQNQTKTPGLTGSPQAVETPIPAPIQTPTPTPSPAPTPTPLREPKKFFVFIVARQFQPATLEIRTGDTVTWVNKDKNALHWPASDPHPTHTALSGFDPLGDLGFEESFSYTFTAAGSIPYHDHSAAVVEGVATIKGMIVVTQ